MSDEPRTDAHRAPTPRRRWHGRLVTAVAALLPGLASAGCDLSSFDIPVRIVESRPVAMLNLNGTDVPMLLDSGAFFSMLPESTVTQLNLKRRSLPDHIRIEGYAGRIDAGMTRVEKVKFGGIELKNVEFIVGGNEINAGIKGVMGRNFLSIGDTEFDLAHGVVRLVFPKGDCAKADMAYWAGGAPVIEAPLDVSFRDDVGKVRVAVRLNGHKVRALLDTGAPSSAVNLLAARRAGVEMGDLKPIGTTGGAGEGRVRAWIGTIASFELGGETIANNRLEVDDTEQIDEPMLIGLDYFLSHRIYVSRLQRKFYATYNGGPVFAQTWEGADANARHAAALEAVADNDADGLARRGAAAAARRDYKRALADLDRACELAPQTPAHFVARAHVLAAMHERARALKDLDEALRLNPALHEARWDRAELRASLDDGDGAQQDLKALDAALPPSAHLRSKMAWVYAQLDLAPQALQQWALWLPSHRNDAATANVLNERCWMRARLGIELPEALEDCRQAVRMDRDNPAFQGSLGWLYWRMNDMPKALKAFNDALALRQDLPWSLYGRGLCQRRLGNAQAGDRDLEAARRQWPRVDEIVRRAGFPVAVDKEG